MPFFDYFDNIPFRTHNPSVDQPNMQTNTNSIDSIIAVDHYSFETNSDGWHKQSTYPVQTAPTTVAGQVAIYSKTGAVSSELFMIRDGNAGTEVALTTSKIGNASAATNGASWLPGGILIQWGRATKSTNGAVTFLNAFPNAVFSVTVSILENNDNRHFIQVKTIALNQFTVASRDAGGNDESNTFSWMAIGN